MPYNRINRLIGKSIYSGSGMHEVVMRIMREVDRAIAIFLLHHPGAD